MMHTTPKRKSPLSKDRLSFSVSPAVQTLMNKGGNIARPAGSVEGCEKTSHAEKAGECQSLFLILAFGSLFCFFFLQPAGSVAIRPSALFCEPFSLGASCCCTRHSPSCFGTELSLEITHRSHGSGWSNHAAVKDKTGLGAPDHPPNTPSPALQ